MQICFLAWLLPWKVKIFEYLTWKFRWLLHTWTDIPQVTITYPDGPTTGNYYLLTRTDLHTTGDYYLPGQTYIQQVIIIYQDRHIDSRWLLPTWTELTPAGVVAAVYLHVPLQLMAADEAELTFGTLVGADPGVHLLVVAQVVHLNEPAIAIPPGSTVSCVWVSVCVCVRERERERERVSVCVCVC